MLRERIVLELTERFAVADYKPLVEATERLRESGVRIAVDDAGADFASMRHILQLNPDLIKLDRSIISGIDADPGRRALGRAMVSFAAELGAMLVAEGIETETELCTVTELGMNAGQGYLLGRPSVQAEDWLGWQGPASGAARRGPP
jgi:EAL domain-containing protein (putative c-di-GMP-specific phosphodiesterase class I)